MHPLLRTVLAVIAGILISFCVILLTEWLTAKYFPSDILYPTIKEIEIMIAAAPLAAKLFFLGGHALSSFFGSYAASRLAVGGRKIMAGFTVGFLLFLGGVVLFISISHPIWLVISTCVAYPLFSTLGALAGNR